MTRLKSFALAAALLLSAGAACADLLVDRGLPGANLNNDAGANRSNVAWVDGGYTNATTPYYLLGDTFSNTTGQAWAINTIRVWAVGNTTTARLLGGLTGGSMGVASGSAAISSALYSGGATYQGTSGSPIGMFELDFSVNIVLAAGESYSFFLDGTGGAYTVPFMHASNAALSGSPQDGSDDMMLSALLTGDSLSEIASWTSAGNGWDKASDFNVQVFGDAVPEPASLALVGLGLACAAGVARRRKV